MTDNRVATRRGNNDLYIRGINVSRESVKDLMVREVVAVTVVCPITC